MLKIGIVEDNPTLNKIYINFFLNDSNIDVLFTLEKINDIKRVIAIKGKPDILLLDIDLDGKSSVEDIPFLVNLYSSMKIIMISGSEDEQSIKESIKKGAVGYVVKSPNLKSIKDAIMSIAHGSGFFCPRASLSLCRSLQRQNQSKYDSLLTPREKDVVALVQFGHSYQEIADKMNVTKFSVNQHLKRIYAKFQVKSKGELISKLLSEGS